jgi:nucleoside-diphosphate-sugar epimerase
VEVLRGCKSLKLAVFASTMLVCRIGYQPNSEDDYRPSTAYGASKVEGERIVRRLGAGHFPWVIVRPTSIWGPWFGAPYRDFFTAIQRNHYVHPRGKRIRRSYGFVGNSVWQLDRLASVGSRLFGRTVYLADYAPIELKEFAEAVQRAIGARPVREIPVWLLRTAAIIGDVLKKFGYRTPPMSSLRLNNMLTEMVHDTALLRDVCGELPYSMQEGISITCDWLRTQRR